MSLDNIQLPPFLIHELYKNSLIEEENKQLKTKTLKSDKPAFLGKNKKNILILVNDENAMYLPDETLNFLIGILAACNLTLNDTALLNVNHNQDINYKTIQEIFKPTIILFFGIEPELLSFPLQFPHYQLQSYNKQTYLSAPSLEILAAEKPEKVQLWACLKTLFAI